MVCIHDKQRNERLHKKADEAPRYESTHPVKSCLHVQLISFKGFKDLFAKRLFDQTDFETF